MRYSSRCSLKRPRPTQPCHLTSYPTSSDRAACGWGSKAAAFHWKIADKTALSPNRRTHEDVHNGHTPRMIERMSERRKRITLSLSPEAAAALERLGAGNQSAYAERLVMAAALAESVQSHAAWFARNPGFLDEDQAERDAMDTA